MLKPISLTTLFAALHEPITATSAHFLILLGTKTKFTPTPTMGRRDYERGETLSYTAKALVELMDEVPLVAKELESHDAHAFCSPSVDLLNGPSMIGSDVGDRIAQALYLALLAAAQGKTTLDIMGHSRGAVEGLLLMHEIERIKQALISTPDKPMTDILIDSPCAYTRAALVRCFPKPSSESKENRALLKQRLKALELNSFLIDPVPGETDVRLIGSHLSWRDARIHQKPPGNDHELLLCRDERSTGFYPVLPEGMMPLIIPGHHGSASGNPYTQSKTDLPPPFSQYDTFTVQNLVLYKLLNFIHRTTKNLHQKEKLLNLGHPELDKILNEYLSSKPEQREEGLLAHYVSVLKNNPAFLQFVNSSYAPFALSYGRATAEDGHRLVRHATGYLSMSSLIHNTPFVNDEHTNLLLAKHLPSLKDSMKSPEKKLKHMSKLLYEMMKTDTLPWELGENGKDSRTLFLHSLSLAVENICQSYLTSALSDKEQKRLMSALEQPFELSIESIKDKTKSKHHPFFEASRLALQEGIKHEMDAQLEAIIQQSRALQEEPCHVPEESLIPNLKHIEQVYAASKTLQKRCRDLLPFLDGQMNPRKMIDITAHDTALIRQAGLLLVTNKVDLSKPPEALTNSFFKQISIEAIALGAESPELRAMIQKNAQQHQHIEDLERANQRLKSPKELHYAELIRAQLSPLTKDYLHHLRREANGLTPTEKKLEINARMKGPTIRDPDQAKAYGYIQAKFNAVHGAYQILMHNQGLPSERVNEFVKTLKMHETRLQCHRDPAWIAYMKACLAVVAIIATGILPGVLALSIYAYRTRKSPFFFAQSAGGRFVEEVHYLSKPEGGF